MSDKKRKAMEKLRKSKKTQMQKVRKSKKTHKQNCDADFRMLVILSESNVNEFSVNENDHDLCTHFKDFTLNQNVNTDFVEQALRDGDDDSELFQWVPSKGEGSGMKITTKFGIIPIWAFLVCVLLCVEVEEPHLQINSKTFPNCTTVVEKVIQMVRFTTSDAMARLANSTPDGKHEIASKIGSKFEMVVVTGGAEFCSYGKGKCAGTGKKLYDFLASDLAATHGVSEI